MFKFSPEDGLLNISEFPNKPSNGTVARNQFMILFNQIRDYINSMESNGIKANGGNASTVGGKSASDFATNSHNHDSKYAATSHTHSEYAATSHTHSEYSTTSHTHSGYASSTHTHSGYAATSHTHDRVNGVKVFSQQSQPTAGAVGDIWISW